MAHLVTLATCNLNQWALDWEGNRDRILESIKVARERGALFRTGPELEITGYGCLDHYLENDTFFHSWEMLADILKSEYCGEMLIDIGMPVSHKNVRYNCRVICHRGKVVMIRPKLWLANDGNYREMRYFTPWMKHKYLEDHVLPDFIRKLTGQIHVPFGDGKLSIGSSALGFETCEELFTPHSPHIDLALDGVEIFTNSSGSHHELRKFDTRLKLITEATRKCGGAYLYANQRGCDGDRLYYDGSAMIVLNGEVIAQGSQFSLKDVEVVSATISLDQIRSYRSSPSFGMQSTISTRYPKIELMDLDAVLGGDAAVRRFDICADSPLEHVQVYKPEEEITLGPACWLWDYLRRSRTAGYFLPLSGGIDSCSTAVIVHSMCCLVVKEAGEGNEQVIEDARRIANKEAPWVPTDPRELANLLFYTAYMGTQNSSKETRHRANELSKSIGSYHLDVNIDSCVSAIQTLFSTVTKMTPKFKVYGGSDRENLALQNIQSRLRMVIAYLFASLLPWTRSRPGGLLVLGSANVDEVLRGYLTKYDNSSADINPIGGISKADLKMFIAYAQEHFHIPVLHEFLEATPAAELEPITHDYVQSDEADMGLTYDELSVFGRLRKIRKLGPYSTFMYLCHEWKLAPVDVATKVKRFFYYYAINRHKSTVLTPAYHAEQYSPDDNRYDLRPFLIRPFTYAFKKIDEMVEYYEKKDKSD